MKTIPFFPQERPESCVPACLRMVLAYHGVERNESELCACCETDVDGTLPSAVVRCAQRLGFDASAARLADLDALQEYLTTAQSFPIVCVNLAPIRGVSVIHAVIIQAIDPMDDHIQVIDPAYPPTGRRTWALGLFEVGWRLARRQVILLTSRL